MELDPLVGQTMLFYGVDNKMFRVDDYVFEVIEDPSDGYRSFLGAVERIDDVGIFFQAPLAIVRLEIDRTGMDEGYRLVDDEFDHIWLRFGTNNDENYYPCFYFNYTPRPPQLKSKSSPKVRRIHDHEFDPLDRFFDQRHD